MRAFLLEQFGGVENLLLKQVDLPEIKVGEVLVKTKAIGINPVDYKTCQGAGAAKRLTLPIILGWDVSGEVVKADKSSEFKVGDKIFGMINFPEAQGKTYAEYVATKEQHITRKPENVSFAEAAAVPLAALTAYQALVKEAKVHQGDRVLIQGASGGVGHLAVQLAKNAGAYVIGVASAKRRRFLLDLGVDQVIDYTKEKFESVAKEVNLALDCVGGDVTARTLKLMRDGGVMISTPAPIPEEITNLRPKVRTPWLLVHTDKGDIEHIASLMTAKKLSVHVARTFAFEEIRQAQYELEHNRVAGKIAVTL